LDDREVRQHVARAEMLLGEIESLPDLPARATAVEMVQILFELYGEGLARLVKSSARLGGEALLDAFAEDELISHLLLLHELHPVDVETRVQRALQEVRPYLASHGGDVELLSVAGGIAHLRLLASGNGFSSSAAALKPVLERAIQKAAPELVGIDMEEAMPRPRAAMGSFIPISALLEQEGANGDG